MLISCNSCNAKYLVNSADLKPSGREVQCAKCGNQWFQQDTLESANITQKVEPVSKDDSFIDNNSYNLPTTYLKQNKVSILNSFLIVIFIIFFMAIFLFLRNLEINTLVLFKFYLNEFFFNFRLIINDIAEIFHNIIN